MLPLSNLTITLKKSTDYLRLTIFIHGLAWFVLINSSFPASLLVLLSIILIISLAMMIKNPVPLKHVVTLSQHKKYWLYHDTSSSEIKYEHIHISFDGGLFILLTLTANKRHRKIVVFKDQLTQHEYRLLNVLTKTT